MTDFNTTPVQRSTQGMFEPGQSNVQLIYVCYLLGFVVGITTLFGVVLAYINRGKAGGWIETHYTWIIRTFWIGMLYGLISVVLMFVLIGFLTALATFVWVVVRLVKGIQAAGRNAPIANPGTWWI